MAQDFPKWANEVPLYVVVALALLAPAAVLGMGYYFSPEYTDVGYMPEQPVPYSHKLHVGELGLDCRYCHAQVEVSAVASVPPTAVCMNCHAIVGRDKATLEPVRESAESGLPIRWVRIHKVPEYAYFDHSVHVRAGVGCSTCHGDVAQMEVVRQVEPLSMRWCLDCHRDPSPFLRPADEITNTAWVPTADQRETGRELMEQRGVDARDDCSACHR